MTKKKHKFKFNLKKIKKVHLSLGLAVFFAVVVVPLTFLVLYFGRIYPGVSVAGVNLSGKTPGEALKILSSYSPPKTVTLTASGSTTQTFEIPTESFAVGYDLNKTADAAYRYGRTGNPVFDSGQIVNAFFHPKDIGIRLSLDEELLAKSIYTVAGQVAVDPVNPSAEIKNGKLSVDKGKKGTTLDENRLRVLIGEALSHAKSLPIEIPILEVDPTLNSFEEAAYTKRATDISQKILTIGFEDKNFEYTGNDIITLLAPKGGFDETKVKSLSYDVATTVNRAPQEAKFNFDSSQKRVSAFQPSKDGIRVEQDLLTAKILDALSSLESSQDKKIAIDLPIERTSPVVQTGDVNNLGINELIGRGTSVFRGSIASRVFNVNLAATRISGTLVAPGDSFSFNNAVGDISEFSGYQKAYIIQDGKTILGDGGGVCQVSTTLFRAVLDAGLPITERSAHAYRVYYYEQDAPPGMDATVYSPTVDFKFKNDTPGYILVQAIPDSKHYRLTFELYGTKDGRVSEVGKPIIKSTTPPPDDVYQDDPSLPVGTIKQTEHRALGTNLYMNYKVTKGGKVIFQKTFYSNYKPWGNVFLRGTGV